LSVLRRVRKRARGHTPQQCQGYPEAASAVAHLRGAGQIAAGSTNLRGACLSARCCACRVRCARVLTQLDCPTMATSKAPSYAHLTPPAEGETITMSDSRLSVPDKPVIPFIEGDGTGPDIWRASKRVIDAAVKAAYGDSRQIVWFEVLAGEKAKNAVGSWLPDDTLEAIRHHLVAIKGPLTT